MTRPSYPYLKINVKICRTSLLKCFTSNNQVRKHNPKVKMKRMIQYFIKIKMHNQPSKKERRKKKQNPSHPFFVKTMQFVWYNQCIWAQVQNKVPLVFDTESYLIAIDNNSSCCIFNDINNFITPLTPKKFLI